MTECRQTAELILPFVVSNVQAPVLRSAISTCPILWSICIYWNRRVVATEPLVLRSQGFLHSSQAVAWSDFPISTLLCKSAILKVPSNLPSTLASQEQFCTGTVATKTALEALKQTDKMFLSFLLKSQNCTQRDLPAGENSKTDFTH